MNPIERDDFLHSLGTVYEFFGKELDSGQASIWVHACGHKSVPTLKRAMMDYIKVGKFAPRPAHILEIADNMTAQRNTALPPPEIPKTDCPPDIANAWMWFINRSAKGSAIEGLFDEHCDVDLATQERYLHVVNHEAHKYGMPDAIADEYKLQEVWG